MKKIILVLLSLILCLSLFGCKHKSVLKDGEEVNKGDIYNDIISINKNIKIKFINDPYLEGTLEIYIPIEQNNDKKESEEFDKITNDVFNKINNNIKDYKEVKTIKFYPVINGNEEKVIDTSYIKNSLGEFEIYGVKANEDSFKIINGNYKEKEVQNDNSVDYTMKNTVIVPSNKGEFKVPKDFLKNITPSVCELNYSRFYLDKEGENKIIKIDLTYNKKVMTVGVITKIRNNIENTFNNKCNEIDLTITQKKPMDLYECKFKNGKWDKEVK